MSCLILKYYNLKVKMVSEKKNIADYEIKIYINMIF